MEYKLEGATVRVHTHYLANRRYIVRRGDYEADAYTFSEAEEKIRNLRREAMEKAVYTKLKVYTKPKLSDEEKASHDLDSYAQIREAVFDISVPAEVYEGKPIMSLGEYLNQRREVGESG